MPSQTTTQIDNQPVGVVSERLPEIVACLKLICDDKEVLSLHGQIESAIHQNDKVALIALYHKVIPYLEKHLWSDIRADDGLSHYQALFCEMENLIASQPTDNRHHITIAIPVADRPRQLTNCIDSLLAQYTQYCYGSQTSNQFNKISVIIADDSIHTESIKHTRLLCEQTEKAGLPVKYFGRDEQDELVSHLSRKQKDILTNQLGQMKADRTMHKGPSVMRNLCYLYLNSSQNKEQKDIFYFIDSDQLFSTNPNDSSEQSINYFYYLDRIFDQSNAQVLTGKVVGDPPVSPAVMANTLLADVTALLQKILHLPPDNTCQFHQHNTVNSDAAYHDMADLFGFTPDDQPYIYDCPLPGDHTNHDCLVDFCQRLNLFFHGEHPTRSTLYQYSNPLESTTPARTVYTGNYALKPDALSYFIPFSNLRLRMAGPTLGRLLKSVIGKRFISTNLPMLHKRTLSDTGKAESRPGIDITDNLVDLTQEYSRQYFGDVMLFSVERLITMNYPATMPDDKTIRRMVYDTEAELYKKYSDKRQLVMENLERLQSLIQQVNHNQDTNNQLRDCSDELEHFINNMQFNFDSNSASFKHISDKTIKAGLLEDIVKAISHYQINMENWNNTLASSR